jgi:hypothetical protein
LLLSHSWMGTGRRDQQIHPKTLQKLARRVVLGVQVGKLWRFRATEWTKSSWVASATIHSIPARFDKLPRLSRRRDGDGAEPLARAAAAADLPPQLPGFTYGCHFANRSKAAERVPRTASWTGASQDIHARLRMSSGQSSLCVTIARAPRIQGANLTKLDAFTRSLKTNKEVIEINQKAWGKSSNKGSAVRLRTCSRMRGTDGYK